MYDGTIFFERFGPIGFGGIYVSKPVPRCPACSGTGIERQGFRLAPPFDSSNLRKLRLESEKREVPR